MGAYAVQYITFYHEEQRGYFEAQIKIGYRRTAEQIQSVTNATTPEALYSLLAVTLDAGKTELAVRISYWGADGRERVAQVVSRLRTDRGLEEEPGWTIRYYPESEPAGLVEILLDVPPEETESATTAPEATEPATTAPQEPGTEPPPPDWGMGGEDF